MLRPYNAAMNIVMVGPFGLRPKGTMAVRAMPLARALVERGHQITVVLPPWNCPEDSGKRFTDGGVSAVNIVLPPRIPLLAHLLITWRLLRRALAQQPDVIHCFKPKAYAGLVALAIWLLRRLRLARARLVVDSDDWEGPGGWNEIERYNRVQKAFFAWQERWGLTHADVVTVASRTLQSLVWSLGVPPSRVVYLPNGCNETLAEAREAGSAPAHGLTVLLYTRFFEFKVARAVEIIAGVLRAVPQARCVVVGAGLFGEEEEFLRLVRQERLTERVFYAGWQQPDTLPSFFASADVAIYPCDDTLVNRAKCAVKLIDLLAAGVPVVADRVGQNGEYIEHLESGMLVEPGDTASFVQAVVRLLHDSGQRQRMGANARRRMTEGYTWATLSARAEAAYR